MIDDAELAEHLRRALDDHQDVLVVPPGLMAAARTRHRQRRSRSALLAAAVVAMAAGTVGVVVAGPPDDATTVTAGPGRHEGSSVATTPSTEVPVPRPILPTGSPTQTPGEAARDGVPLALATLPIAVRIDEQARVGGGLETWVVSRPAEVAWDMAANGDGNFGDIGGTYGLDWIHVTEYSEVLLLGSGVPIIRAYPMPSLVPSWIHLTDDAVYAGRLGDGGMLQSSLVRIDRATLEAEVIVFQPPQDVSAGLDLHRPGWRNATAEEAGRYEGLVTSGPDAVGTLVTTTWGPDGRIGVDLAGVEAIFAGS